MWIDEQQSTPELTQPAYVALGPDVYAGTSGIALLLSEMYACTGKRNYRKTSIGAIEQALSIVSKVEKSPFSFYSGVIGIAYASIALGFACESEVHVSRGLELLEGLEGKEDTEHELDVIGGNAGAIPALLKLHRLCKRNFLVKMANRLGDQIIQKANRAEIGWSWPSFRPNKTDDQGHNLLGFAHGTSGFAWALLELYKETGKLELLTSADQAFQYERHWFNPRHQNWPDLREMPSTMDSTQESFAYPCQWCHGAPGIGLSRLRAYQITGSDIYKQEALIALQSTERWMDGIKGEWNYSLCHGYAGNADIFNYAGSVLGDPKYLTLARAVGRQGIRRFGRASTTWPCGIPEGESPGLMLGHAGIAHFYLRLYDPSTVDPVVIVLPS